MEGEKEERRPTDADQPKAKRRAEGTHRGREDVDEDHDNEVSIVALI
jgi:hypothetical protein